MTNCNNAFPPANEGSSNELSLRYPEPDDSTRRAYHDMKRDQMTNLRGFKSPQEFGQFVQQYMDRSFMTAQASLAASNIGRVTNMGNLIAMYSPSWLGPNNPARQLRDWLMDAKASGEHLLDTAEFWARDLGDSAARFQFSATIRDSYNEFLRTASSRKLSKRDLDGLWADMNELGQKERLMRFNGNNEFSYRVQQRQVAQMFERARSLGFSDVEIDRMMTAAKKHADVYDSARAVVNVAGVDLDATPDLGYFPRQATDDASYFLRRAEAANLGLDGNNSAIAASAAAVLKSRQTFDFVVEDVVLYADAVGINLGLPSSVKKVRQSYNTASKAADQYAEKVATRPRGRTDAVQARMEARLEEMTNKAAGLREAMMQAEMRATSAVAAHFTDERILVHDFLERIDPKTLDRLVDSGVIGKVPMPSRRVFQVLKARYNLPFDGLADLIETDPVRSFQQYKQSLQQAMGASQLVNDLHVNAPALGLGVTGQAFREAPTKFDGYRPMQQLLDKYGISTTNMAAGDVRLAPYVYDQMDAIMKASTEPAVMNSLDRIWRDVTSWFKSSVLATPQFVFRNVVEVTMQAWRAGTNLAKMQPAMQYYRDFLRLGPEGLPTEKVFAHGTLSVRDIFENLVQSGRLKMTSPIEGISVSSAVRTETEQLARMLGYKHNPGAVFDANNLMPFLQRLGHQLEAGDVMGAAGFSVRRMNKAQRAMFENMVKPLAWTQDAAVVANLLTTLDDSPWARVGQFFSTSTTPAFDNVVDAMRHVDEYIYRYQTGVADNWVKHYVPFWSYMSNAMPAAFRNILRNPGQHMAYQRLYAAINGDARQDEEFTQAGTPAWFGEMVPIVFRDPEGRDGMWFSVDMSRIDPTADLFRRLSATSDLASKLTGGHPGRFNEQIAQVMGDDSDDFLFDLVGSNMGPIVNTFLAGITQRDPFLGREFQDEDEVFGLKLNGSGNWTGGFQRYLIDTWMPQLRWVERQARITGISSRTEVGPDGQERVRPELTNAFAIALNTLGLSVTTIEVARNLQNTEIDMRVTGFELRDRVRALESKAKSEPDPQAREDILVEAAMLEALMEQVQMVEEYAQEELTESGNLTYTERREVIRERSDENYEMYLEMQGEINR